MGLVKRNLYSLERVLMNDACERGVTDEGAHRPPTRVSI
jgi:hypothetical protein